MRINSRTTDTDVGAERPAAKGDQGDFARTVVLTDTDCSSAVERAKVVFSQEGFGTIAELDFRALLKQRLDKDIGPHWVLEICHPHLADRALALGHAAGLFMPCRVGVWQHGRDAVVAVLRPEILVSLAGSEPLQGIAAEAEGQLERALARLASAPAVPAGVGEDA